MKKSFASSLCVLAFPILVSGCSSDKIASFSEKQAGTQVDAIQYASLKPGQTASEAVLRMLGQPSKIQKKAGKQVWIYTFHTYNSNPMITNRDSYQAVFVEFDHQGILTKRWRKDTKPDGDNW
ncbi:outer membrane protein assembly factor BamE domain-containing protein [Pseudomonas putida]|uniref:Outer membrane protein assembly factor BamE n=1 Tax=Pseudomonas putida TaxID=303 RepID=A0A8I1EDE2_PSEPU|nr:outer membrane protein assembly factor BamE [Pseudomonas putida]MBI6883219.1 outer membrane protein assembly factor BamE [Pseudomonas putida]